MAKKKKLPKQLAILDEDLCTGCDACVVVCPVDCIYDKDEWEVLFIHPEECIDCGLCIDACPVQAIYPMEELPEKWSDWIAKNFEAFDLEAP